MKFFEELATTGHYPALKNTSGTLCFELKDGKAIERWYVTSRKGDIEVSRQQTESDAVISCHRALFENILSGSTRPITAMLRGELVTEGDMVLIATFGQLFGADQRLARDAGPARRTAR